MNILLILVPCSLALGIAAIAAFVWTLSNDQYEDLEGDAARCLTNDDAPDP